MRSWSHCGLLHRNANSLIWTSAAVVAVTELTALATTPARMRCPSLNGHGSKPAGQRTVGNHGDSQVAYLKMALYASQKGQSMS